MERRKFIKAGGIFAAALPLNSLKAFKIDPMIENYQKLCSTCGTQFPINSTVEICSICAEERQYIPITGQSWTTHRELLKNHTTKVVQINKNLYEIVIEPTFAIGQRAFLVISESGNVLWDCIPLLDEKTINFIQSKGGLKAIAFSHPHYYSNMNDWASTFNCQIYIHKKDASYIVDNGEHVILWEGNENPLWDDLKLVNIGGHFDGSSVIMIPSMSKNGTMLCGDTMYLSLSKKHFAIMYSYPNRIPLPISEIKRIKNRLTEISFDTVYGFYSYQNVSGNAKDILTASFEKYLRE